MHLNGAPAAASLMPSICMLPAAEVLLPILMLAFSFAKTAAAASLSVSVGLPLQFALCPFRPWYFAKTLPQFSHSKPFALLLGAALSFSVLLFASTTLHFDLCTFNPLFESNDLPQMQSNPFESTTCTAVLSELLPLGTILVGFESASPPLLTNAHVTHFALWPAKLKCFANCFPHGHS